MIDALEEEMQKAAEELDFEKAAELRNMLEDLRNTTNRCDVLPGTACRARSIRRPTCRRWRTPWLRMPAVMECFDISNISTTHVVASMVSFRDGVPDKNNYRRYRIRTVEGQDDFASMAEVVRRRYARVLLQARAQNAEAAEFSQESPVEAVNRTSATKPSLLRHPERSAADRGIPRRHLRVL